MINHRNEKNDPPLAIVVSVSVRVAISTIVAVQTITVPKKYELILKN